MVPAHRTSSPAAAVLCPCLVQLCPFRSVPDTDKDWCLGSFGTMKAFASELLSLSFVMLRLSYLKRNKVQLSCVGWLPDVNELLEGLENPCGCVWFRAAERLLCSV